MEDNNTEDLKKLIKTLKILDWSEDDIQKVLNINREDIRKIVSNFDLI